MSRRWVSVSGVERRQCVATSRPRVQYPIAVVVYRLYHLRSLPSASIHNLRGPNLNKAHACGQSRLAVARAIPHMTLGPNIAMISN